VFSASSYEADCVNSSEILHVLEDDRGDSNSRTSEICNAQILVKPAARGRARPRTKVTHIDVHNSFGELPLIIHD
jgi:hypothetical protein